MDPESRRLIFHSKLKQMFPGYALYHEPPQNLLIDRPCVIYNTTGTDVSYASNVSYRKGTEFSVTIMVDLPGSSDHGAMFDDPVIHVQSNRRFVEADVAHEVYTVIF